jgi:hypothetical protein
VRAILIPAIRRPDVLKQQFRVMIKMRAQLMDATVHLDAGTLLLTVMM